jgi:hypothetical protein
MRTPRPGRRSACWWALRTIRAAGDRAEPFADIELELNALWDD